MLHLFVQQIKQSNERNQLHQYLFISHRLIQVKRLEFLLANSIIILLDDTIVFYDSTPCVIVRTNTHQYTFCFRRQSCALSQTSAFCTTKSVAYETCQQEKNGSNLLSIENDAEYQLINDVITLYSNQTLLNSEGVVKNKYIQRAQWMWIDGLRGFNDSYGWNTSEESLTSVPEKYWCENFGNCSGGKGRDHLVLNIICQTSKQTAQVCLASRRQSEPGPFICKRTLRTNEGRIIREVQRIFSIF